MASAKGDSPYTRPGHGLLKVAYQAPGDLLADYLSDLSEGGLFIRTAVPFEPGDLVRFSLSFPGLARPLAMRATVRYRHDAQAGVRGEGVGCEFSFRNDQERSRLRRLLTQLRRRVDASGTVRRALFRVLLVDDNHVATQLFSNAVRRFHHLSGIKRHLELDVAGNAVEALELQTRHVYHLAIIDHELPGSSGAALIRRLRRDARLSGMALLGTGRSGVGAERACIEGGANAFLRKPVLLDELTRALQHLAPIALAASAKQDRAAG